jgi:hypothetical protein
VKVELVEVRKDSDECFLEHVFGICVAVSVSAANSHQLSGIALEKQVLCLRVIAQAGFDQLQFAHPVLSKDYSGLPVETTGPGGNDAITYKILVINITLPGRCRQIVQISLKEAFNRWKNVFTYSFCIVPLPGRVHW